MTFTAAVVIGIGVATLLRRRGEAGADAVGVVSSLVAMVPALLVPAGAAMVAVVAHRRVGRSSRDGEERVALLAELTALGLSAGLSFPQSLGAAAELAGGPIESEVRAVVRKGTRRGLSGELEHATGAARDLYRIAGRALRTGAPIRIAVQAHVDQLRAEERAVRLERARKLPVKMLFPLALLILPGFLVLTVGPTLLGALDRLRM